MRKLFTLLSVFTALLFAEKSSAQIDLNNLDLKDIIGKNADSENFESGRNSWPQTKQ
jgi:hypothetical protein